MLVSNRLVAFEGAGVLGFGASTVDDDAAADRDAIGFLAERFAHGGGQFGPDARRPAKTAEIVARRRDPHLLRIGRGDEYRIQSRADELLYVGGGSAGGGSPPLARMNSGTGERLSAMPQPAIASAPPAINAI